MGAAQASEPWVCIFHQTARSHTPKTALSNVTPVWLYITYNLQENTKRITQVPCNINKSEEINPVQP